jgi:hypothetical protein
MKKERRGFMVSLQYSMVCFHHNEKTSSLRFDAIMKNKKETFYVSFFLWPFLVLNCIYFYTFFSLIFCLVPPHSLPLHLWFAAPHPAQFDSCQSQK